MKLLISILGIIIFLGLAYITSSDRKSIKKWPVVKLFVLQFIFGYILLNTGFGNVLVGGIANGFTKILEYAAEGVEFVFGGLANDGAAPFFLTVLMPIIFISVLIGILQYFNILPFIIKYLGKAISKVNGMGQLESYNGIASIILGQSEVFISVKKQLAGLSEKRMYTLCASAMSTVSMSIVGSYMTLLEPRYVVTAIILNLFGGFIITSIINPYELDPSEEDEVVINQEKQSFFEMLVEYIMDGFMVAITVGAMLIGFVAMIAMVNGIFDALFGIDFQEVLGYIFSPVAFLIGVPWEQAIDAGSIMATKLVSNEFVAMTTLKTGGFSFDERTNAIVSVFLVSFANFTSIGVIAGAVNGLNKQQGKVVAKFGLRLLWGATLVSLLSAGIIGIILM
ncbi:NupC/NupG family nucleoside CNT transporter [Vagococcus coleopterorum]|uniref:NupC/NupG family nucleoside CNT transporter n=1 Tax=Vagococcus coleopterorum TaxID=2714946 RepID=A0A6G8ALA5_9ENTE|nr:nucleoside transporter C-terminal domain-containing protein [Vagococcus coleopterorum]QIL45760.1 NupC/NupG family nucleoside CNT transporter [Vagococcus coleopterorum]